MCGIAAVIGATKQNKQTLEEMLLPIKHRGEKQHFNESSDLSTCVLGMNRLAIVDRKRAKQPMASVDGRFHIVYNGEVYNYQELQKKLKDKGYGFQTNSDTEVLVNGYAEWGEKLLNKISGMFTFFIFDKKNNSFFAARDPLGVKPLYWAKDKNNTYYFGSEIKSLATVKKVKKVNLFPPAHFMKNGRLKKYWTLSVKTDNKITEAKAIKQIRVLFDNAVKIRVQTDLPVAVYLSGGVDSTAVLATAVKYNSNVTAIIVGSEKSTDKKTAVKYCRENHIKYIVKTPPTETELSKHIPDIIKVTESFEPNMIRNSAVSYHIAKTAAVNGFKIILCGEGADELFAGYPEFKNFKHNQEIKQGALNFLSDLHRTQLQRVDRTSMAFTTEVRVPFLDKELTSYVLKIPAKLLVKKVGAKIVTKYILRKAVSDRLPEYIYSREKIVLIEGAGYKGNQQIGGMFYDIVSQKVSDKKFTAYRHKYPDWHLKTKEEVYYFKYFLQFGYSKAKFNQRRTIVNKITTI